MSTYIFVLGKDAELSTAELYSVYPDALFSHLEEGFVIMETPEKIDQLHLNKLGGILKIAKLVEEVSRTDLERAILDTLLDEHESGKLNYGISLYGWPENNLKTVLIGLKKCLKLAGVSSRFANQNFINLSIAQKKGLKGPELLVAQVGEVFFVAEVVAAQDIDGYSKRDFDKPFRDMKVGMLPPKLAQIMLNLTKSKGAIWDPFCGGGVLVMEGMLMGYDMLGSDINQETLGGAEKNISWTKSELGASTDTQLFHHDATQPLHDKIFDAIAFEGYLGPPQFRQKAERELRPVVAELDKLYIQFFRALKKANFKGVIVAALPFYRLMHGEELGLSCVDDIQDMGFELDNLIPGTSLKSINYARKDQMVGREILRFRLN